MPVGKRVLEAPQPHSDIVERGRGSDAPERRHEGEQWASAPCQREVTQLHTGLTNRRERPRN